MSYVPNPTHFERLPDKNRKRYYRCRLCQPSREQEAHNCKTHEKTFQHQRAVRLSQKRPTTPSPPPPDSDVGAVPPPHIPITDDLITEDGMRAFLAACSADPSQPLYPLGHPFFSQSAGPSVLPTSRSQSPITGIDWNVLELESSFDTPEENTPEQELLRQLSQKTLDLLNGDISDFDADVNSTSSDSDECDNSTYSNDLPQKRSRGTDIDLKTAREWFPWPDRISCTLDIIMHLPRSVFSRKQLDLFLWLLRVNQVHNVPSGRSTKEFNKVLQNTCGVQTHQYQGKLGHPYFVNSLAQILAQEMCNPRVRPHLHFYPEDSGKRVEETRQASNWLHELSPDDATPMVRIRKQDYYVYEPTMLSNWTYCIPFRWYIRQGKFRAKAWTLEAKHDTDHAQEGWVVRKDLLLDISEDDLFLSFPQFSQHHSDYGVPQPSRILGVRSIDPMIPSLEAWNHTNPVLGNRWRILAKGHRTLSIPLWMYCDDTSGNQSKKWNEHNSFLFTLAGLPREEVSKEYNIHFLCTSNIAPPLEMLDGVVQQIQDAKQNGIWAWDCEFHEPVLLDPTPISKLGDNPMQSEFCCHVGSRGKFFCRICKVKGSDVDDQPKHSQMTNSPLHSPASSVASNSEESVAEDPPSAGLDAPNITSTDQAKRKVAPESMQAMFRRISDFMKPGAPRTKKETQSILASFYEDAKTLHTKSKLAKRRTETGVKDTIQEFFFTKLFSSYKKKHGTAEKQRALDAAIAALPDEITSPIWRLGLDPHQDTPVEILHVVLLGFVKYFWRDLVQNQVNKDQKPLLIARLNSIDTNGLGISRLRGETLVTYAGSLTGRDFRAICQVAPFVIYDMVPSDVFAAWVALSTLVPLIWQPVIEDIDKYCATLETEIQNFLIKTIKWTCAWFNKSKFHILLHLPDHIRRFGPAILFATEAFESFNAVIRAKSIHSNRQAPSRDIALAFAQGNRIRHLISGGLILSEEQHERKDRIYEGLHASDWKPVGVRAKALLEQDPTPASYLGLEARMHKSMGCLNIQKKQPCEWGQTLTGQHFPERAIATLPSGGSWVTYNDVVLANEDVCSVGTYVIVNSSAPFVACVREAPQSTASKARGDTMPEGILLQQVRLVSGEPPLPMPRPVLEDVWHFLPLSASVFPLKLLCTVNVQHDCRRQQCKITGSRYVRQERVRSEVTAPIVEHSSGPNDLILNMAQMRDAVHLQKFRQTSQLLDEKAVAVAVQHSVAQAIDARKSNQSNRNQSSRGRGRGRGRRGAAGEGVGMPSRGRGQGRGFIPSSPGERIIDFS